MKRKEVSEIALRLGRDLAIKAGFDERDRGVFMRSSACCERVFRIDSTVTHEVGELTIFLGIEVPALDELVSAVPGLERGSDPSFGGPVFRFADLTGIELHDLIVKVRSQDDLAAASAQLWKIWNRFAVSFFEHWTQPVAWIRAVEDFSRSGMFGPFKVPTIGRVCVALKHAAEGCAAADQMLENFSNPSDPRRVQDLAQAIELQRLIRTKPELLSRLIEVLDQRAR